MNEVEGSEENSRKLEIKNNELSEENMLLKKVNPLFKNTNFCFVDLQYFGRFVTKEGE